MENAGIGEVELSDWFDKVKVRREQVIRDIKRWYEIIKLRDILVERLQL